MTFRDTRHLQLIARPGQTPSEPANASERLRLARAFGMSLDALVQALIRHSNAVDGLVTRATDAARAVADLALHVEASGITLDGEQALQSTPDSGRWILQTWYAGLRGITVLPDVRAEDVRGLAVGFARAQPGTESIDHLASWLWSTPVDGIALELRTSAVERIEAVTGDASASRSALRSAWLDAADRAVKGADPFAARPAAVFARERAWWSRALAGDLAVSVEEAQALRTSVEDSAALLREELMTAMNDAAWQQALPSVLVARALTRLAATTHDKDLNSLSGLLGADEADYGRVCVAELANFPVGESLAKSAPLRADMTPDELAALQSLFNRLPEATAVELMHGLLRRMSEQPDVLLPVFGAIARTLTIEIFLRLAAPAKLANAIRPLVGRILLAAAPSADEWAALASSLPIGAFLEVLRATPAESLEPLVPALSAALKQADARGRTQIVMWLADPVRVADLPHAAIVALTDALLNSGGTGWELRTARVVADLALRAEYAGAALLEMMRDPKAPANIRVSLLESLARAPAFASEALKWRMGEMFDAPELRDRLVELRKQRQP